MFSRCINKPILKINQTITINLFYKTRLTRHYNPAMTMKWLWLKLPKWGSYEPHEYFVRLDLGGVHMDPRNNLCDLTQVGSIWTP